MEKDAQYIVYGGQSTEKELFIEPTVIDFQSDFDAFLGSETMVDEIFGPILPIVRYVPSSSSLSRFFFFVTAAAVTRRRMSARMTWCLCCSYCSHKLMTTIPKIKIPMLVVEEILSKAK